MTEDAPILTGVAGWPITQSRSPALHGHWLKRYNINGHYVPLGIRPENFETAIRSLPNLGFRGVNVTIPYKENVLALATSITDRAALIGAANTLIFRDNGGIVADNSDGVGFMQNILQKHPDWSPTDGPILVIGAGGASRAIVSALLSAGAPEVRVTNRTRHRADNLREQFGAKLTVVDWVKMHDAMDGIATLVNSTSLGMIGQPPLKLRINAVPKRTLVTDIVYNPLTTDLLDDAMGRGLRVVDGLGMLLHQAVPGFHAWYDHKPDVDDRLRQAVLSA